MTDGSQPAGALHVRSMEASLTVRDVRASLAWYRDVLGFEVDREVEREGSLRAVSLRAGEVRILIVQDNGEKGMDRVKGEGFSLQLSTAQSVDEIADRIRAAGGALDSEPEDAPWGVRFFRLRDPDGFRFTVSSVR